MRKRDPDRLPPGRQPYDPLNGLRVGALSGGLMGAIATFATGAGYAWLVLVGAGVGGAVGYWFERRSLRRGSAAEPEGVGDPSPGDDSPGVPGA